MSHLRQVDTPKASAKTCQADSKAVRTMEDLLPHEIRPPGVWHCFQLFKESVLSLHVLRSKRKAMLAVKDNDVCEDGAGIETEQLRPKGVPALVDRAARHENARVAVAIFAFLLPLRLHEE